MSALYSLNTVLFMSHTTYSVPSGTRQIKGTISYMIQRVSQGYAVTQGQRTYVFMVDFDDWSEDNDARHAVMKCITECGGNVFAALQAWDDAHPTF